MADICTQNPLNCLNNGQCYINLTSNATYCKCDHCHNGLYCENQVPNQSEFNTTLAYLIVFSIGLFLSLLNNILGLEVFLGCKRIRRTNCGVYLIAYSIISILSSIILVISDGLEYYSNTVANKDWINFPDRRCYLNKIAYNTLVYMCIWLNALIAFERALMLRLNSKANATRWRSIGFLIFVLTVALSSSIPMFVYKCNWDTISSLQTARAFFTWFYVIVGLSIYVVATLLILIAFARHILLHGMKRRSFIKTYLKLFFRHLFVFIPPAAYAIGFIPYTIVEETQSSKQFYFQCGISMAEFIVKVLLESMQGLPPVITWLLFVFPSRVYMEEYYMNTWSGQRLWKIVRVFKRKFVNQGVDTNITEPIPQNIQDLEQHKTTLDDRSNTRSEQNFTFHRTLLSNRPLSWQSEGRLEAHSILLFFRAKQI